MGMGTENENEASFAQRQKSWTGQPEDSSHKKEKERTMQLNFRLAFA
jgi:hypothetical protein